ncbi:MAG: UbiA family prenyltransferase [Stagnimonas sp.]|nr:UbiA family prenyltransferase [Stagnimonas sp.]
MLPLVVDLDGTLIHSDTLHESSIKFLKDSPASVFLIPFWLAAGKVNLKRQIADRTTLDVKTLPYNEAFMCWLRNQRSAGRYITLCSATHRSIAQSVADHLQLFDEVIATENDINLSGERKAAALRARYGEKGFAYAGNAVSDIKVWEIAAEVIVVNAEKDLLALARKRFEVTEVFHAPVVQLATWRKAVRLHQWLKNLLLFLPLLAAHQILNLEAWGILCIAFFAFSLCASAVYLANDLLDLESDRLHPRKKHRPFASGALPLWTGVALVPVLLTASFGLASFLNAAFLGWLAAYFLLTCFYSWTLKRLIELPLLPRTRS